MVVRAPAHKDHVKLTMGGCQRAGTPPTPWVPWVQLIHPPEWLPPIRACARARRRALATRPPLLAPARRLHTLVTESQIADGAVSVVVVQR